MSLLGPAGFLVSTKLGFRAALCMSHSGTRAAEVLSRHGALTEEVRVQEGDGLLLEEGNLSL